MPKEKLMLVTIGPVQNFIEESRRTIDFYAGSEIISNMIKWSYEFLKERIEDIEILYPHKEGRKDFKYFPNYFLSKVKYDDEEIFDDLEKELEENLKDRIKNDIEKILKGLEYKGKYDAKIASNHIGDCFNIYIVYEEYSKDKYSKSYKEIYRKLSANKNTRKFKQMRESGRKCNICGTRNGLFCKELIGSDKFNIRYLDKKNAISLTKTNKLKDNETLCYICFLKRFFDELEEDKKQIYPSTVKLATLGWVNRKKKCQGQLFKKYNNQIKDLFEEKLDEKMYYKDWILDQLKEVKEIKEQIKILYKDENGMVDKPTKYYAVVKMDIDDLGKWLSGEYFNAVDLLDNQKKLSHGLFKFSKGFTKVLENKGKVIYAGGDDFLYFVTLDNLFETIKGIEYEFQKMQSLDFIKSSNRKLTFSTSVVVAHYKTPLQRVLKILNEALNEAKEKYKNKYSPSIPPKNAVAFSFITHSNILRTTYFQRKCNIEYMNNLIINLQQKLSRKFIYSLENEFYKLDNDISYLDMTKIRRIMTIEINRLIYRSWNDRNIQNEIAEEKIKKQANELKKLLGDCFIEIASNEYKLDTHNYFNFLHICEALSIELYDLEGGDK